MRVIERRATTAIKEFYLYFSRYPVMLKAVRGGGGKVLYFQLIGLLGWGGGRGWRDHVNSFC